MTTKFQGFVICAVALCLISAFAIAAQNTNAGGPVHWITAMQPIVLAPGETHVLEAQFYSDVAIPDATAYLSGSVPRFLDRGVRFLGDVEKNQIYTVRRTFTVPLDADQREYKMRIMVGAPTVLSFDNEFRGQGWGTIPDTLPFEIQVVRAP